MKRAPPATPSKVAKRRAAATPKAKSKRAAATTPASSSHTPAWAAAGLAHVAKADGGRLKKIIDQHGPPGYLEEQVAEDSACGALCRIVVGQQLAGAAAASIWRRTLGELCPRGFDRAQLLSRAEGADGFDEDTRSSCGLSRAKARAIVAVCQAFAAGDLSDALLRDAPVSELRDKLCAIKGVGPWSCDMYLIFDLKRPDVLPLGDLGVRNGAQRFFGVSGHGFERCPDTPSGCRVDGVGGRATRIDARAGKNGSLDAKKDRVKLEALFAPYAPYRSLASYYMWRVADTKAFNQKQ
jgi:DNA-3-methyladenine glycosylase II